MVEDIRNGIVVHLTERCVTNEFKFFLDIDFDFDIELPNLKGLLNVIQVHIEFELNKEIECIISTRTSWKIHLNFPGLLVTKYEAIDLAENIREKLKQQFRLDKWNWDKIVDSSVYYTGLRMFGCSKSLLEWNAKNKDLEFPKKTKEYIENDHKKFTGFEFYDLPRIYKLYNEDDLEINPTLLDRMSILHGDISIDDNEIKKELNNAKTKYNIKDEINFNIQNNLKDLIIKKFSSKDFKWRDDDFRVIKWQAYNELIRVELTSRYCLFQKRDHSSNHGYFLVSEKFITFCCHNEECKSLLDIKKKLGKEELFCFGKETLENVDPKGILSKAKFEDDEELDKIVKDFYYYGKDGEVAELLVKLFPDSFRVVQLDLKKYDIYFFNASLHRWCSEGAVAHLLSLFNGDLIKKLKSYEKIMTQWINDNTPSKERRQFLIIKVVHKMMGSAANLKSRHYFNNMTTWVDDYYYQIDTDFLSKLDTSTNLIAFTNGVYELDTENFRDGFPNDYILTGLAIAYNKHVKKERIEFINQWFDSIFPGMPDVKEYFLWYLSSAFDGTNRHQLFAFGTGTGGNGKSTVLKLLNKLFGKANCTLPINMFTSEPVSAEAASPNLANLKGKLIAVIADMTSKNTLYTGLVKTISGQDQIIARKLHGAPIEFLARCILLFMVNDLPENLDDTSDGFLRKSLVIPFYQRFVRKEDYDPINRPWEKLMDSSIEVKVLEHVEEFAVLLLQKYSIYRKSGYKMPKQPDAVKEATRKYKQLTNKAEQFVRDHIVIQDRNTDPLEIKYLAYDDIKETTEEKGIKQKSVYSSLDKLSNFKAKGD